MNAWTRAEVERLAKLHRARAKVPPFPRRASEALRVGVVPDYAYPPGWLARADELEARERAVAS